MHLQLIDWVIVLASLLICFVPALFFGKRAGKNTSEFFASGRSVPWWLAGLSMVATTFSSDTPNWVTEQVRKFGVAGNWQWWAFVLTGVSTVFFFARLWRRSGVMTDLEFYELRYSGKAASVVRGKVTTKSGAPIEDAQISAQTTGGDVRAKTDWASDRTQADGSYELRALKPATYKLEVETRKGVAPRDGVKVEHVGEQLLSLARLEPDDALGVAKGHLQEQRSRSGIHESIGKGQLAAIRMDGTVGQHHLEG
jgi:hypothetical protein